MEDISPVFGKEKYSKVLNQEDKPHDIPKQHLTQKLLKVRHNKLSGGLTRIIGTTSIIINTNSTLNSSTNHLTGYFQFSSSKKSTDWTTHQDFLCMVSANTIRYSLENMPPMNISPPPPPHTHTHSLNRKCTAEVFTISMSIFNYSIISLSLVLKTESYCKRGGVFSSEYGTTIN